MGHKWLWNSALSGLPPESFLAKVDPLLAGVPEKLDGEYATSDQLAGHLCPDWAQALGLEAGIPVPVGALDAHWDVHCTPTYASWLNQVELWFNRITQRAIRRATFRSVNELVTKIDQFVKTITRTPGPSFARRQQIPSSLKSSDYVNVFPGQNTSRLRKNSISRLTSGGAVL